MPPLSTPSKHHQKEFSRRLNHPTSYAHSPAFKGPLRLPTDKSAAPHNPKDLQERIQHDYVSNNRTWSKNSTPLLASSSPSTAAILRAIVNHFACENAPLDVKEVMESIEFYLRTSKRLLSVVKQRQQCSSADDQQQVHVIDAACGHGLTGMLFAACNPQLRVNVTLIDATEPPSHRRLLHVLSQTCPWVVSSSPHHHITFRAMSLEQYAQEVKTEKETDVCTLVVATHACGKLTDAVLELATSVLPQAADALAVMPCCYTGTAADAPYGVKRALGVSWAADIQRTYQLEAKGYRTDFCTIPSSITPMNRIIVAERSRTK